MKKIGTLLLVVLMCVTILTGCTKKEDSDKNSSSKTPAVTLVESFEKEIKDNSDILEVAQKLSENKVLNTKMMVEERSEEDYLAGFDEEITNYKKAVVINPVIGTIPFIAYVFETDNAEELMEELNDKANLRWNICVEADEMKMSVVDNYVFFVMSPKEFEG